MIGLIVAHPAPAATYHPDAGLVNLTRLPKPKLGYGDIIGLNIFVQLDPCDDDDFLNDDMMDVSLFNSRATLGRRRFFFLWIFCLLCLFGLSCYFDWFAGLHISDVRSPYFFFVDL